MQSVRPKPYLPPRATLKFYVAWWVFMACYFGLISYSDFGPRSPGEGQLVGFVLMLGVLSFPLTLIPLLQRKDDFITWLFRALVLPICYMLLGMFVSIVIFKTAGLLFR